MGRTIKATLWFGLLLAGALAGAGFLKLNEAPVNVQFPWVGRESGTVELGFALLASLGIGVALGLVVALLTSLGMSLYASRLKKEIRALRKEVDALRNLPILEEEMERRADQENDLDVLEESRAVDIPDGPFRGGSTAAPIGGDDEDDEEEEEAEPLERTLQGGDKPEDPTRMGTGKAVAGTRKIEVP